MHLLLLIAALLAAGTGPLRGSTRGTEPTRAGVRGVQTAPGAQGTEAVPAMWPARYGFLAHLGLGGYSLSIADASGAANSRASLLGGGAVATRNLSPAFGLGALAELTEFLGDSSGSSSTTGFLIGPAAVFRTGALALTGGAALSALGRGDGVGLGLIAAADVVIGGPFSLHGQVSYRNAFPSGGRVSFLAGELGVGVVY